MALASALRQGGYHVLEAQDLDSIVTVVRTHSRAIHLLVTTWDLRDAVREAQLWRYRPTMKVIDMSRDEMATPELVLKRAAQAL
jgi:hypothetical protein